MIACDGRFKNLCLKSIRLSSTQSKIISFIADYQQGIGNRRKGDISYC